MEDNSVGHIWEVGDVFTTTFWGDEEVCITNKFTEGYIYFIRLESIRNFKTVKKDICGACLDLDLFKRIKKKFLYKSQWYSEYRLNSDTNPERSVATDLNSSNDDDNTNP